MRMDRTWLIGGTCIAAAAALGCADENRSARMQGASQSTGGTVQPVEVSEQVQSCAEGECVTRSDRFSGPVRGTSQTGQYDGSTWPDGSTAAAALEGGTFPYLDGGPSEADGGTRDAARWRPDLDGGVPPASTADGGTPRERRSL